MWKNVFCLKMSWVVYVIAAAVTAEGVRTPPGDGGRWRWPEGQDVRIDTKVQFLNSPATSDRASDDNGGGARGKAQAHADAPFKEATETDGFYNRPASEGRFPVHAVYSNRTPYPVNPKAVYPVNDRPNPDNDGTVDSLLYCKCLSTPDCNPRRDSAEACGTGRYLCCYKQPNKQKQLNTEFFNEIDDERPMLFPGKEKVAGPFPPPPNSVLQDEFGPGHGHETMVLGAYQSTSIADALFGANLDILDNQRPFLFGPGPTGKNGMQHNPGVLVGPGGPTGVVGPAPAGDPSRDNGHSASAQRGILVGPGGPTGIIGPYRNRQRGVLMGPVHPSGFRAGYGRTQGPGVLVGPGGPTGIIGPGRQLLVGPGGPTGQIGPRDYFDYSRNKRKEEHIKPQKKSHRRKHARAGRAVVWLLRPRPSAPCRDPATSGAGTAGSAELLGGLSSPMPAYFRTTAAERRQRRSVARSPEKNSTTTIEDGEDSSPSSKKGKVSSPSPSPTSKKREGKKTSSTPTPNKRAQEEPSSTTGEDEEPSSSPEEECYTVTKSTTFGPVTPKPVYFTSLKNYLKTVAFLTFMLRFVG